MEYVITLKSGVISVYLDKSAALRYMASLVSEGTHFTFTTFEV